MDDLRAEKKKKIEEGGIEEKKPFLLRQEDKLSKFYKSVGFYIKKYKYLVIGAVVLSIGIFPSEIGGFIGNWWKEFFCGVIKN
jgi:hypothetical protein